MPILRYFMFVGAALVALLFVAGYLFPKPELAQANSAEKTKDFFNMP